MKKIVIPIMCIILIFVLYGCRNDSYIEVNNDSFEYGGNKYYPISEDSGYTFNMKEDVILIGWTRTMYWKRVPFYRSIIDEGANFICIDGMIPRLWVKSEYDLPEITDLQIKEIIAWVTDVSTLSTVKQSVWESDDNPQLIMSFLDESKAISSDLGELYLDLIVDFDSPASLEYNSLRVISYNSQLYMCGIGDTALLIKNDLTILLKSAHNILY